MKHFFRIFPLVVFVILCSIISCQNHDDTLISETEIESSRMLLKIIPVDHLKEMSPTVYGNIQKTKHSNRVDADSKELTSSAGFYINDSKIQIIESENFTTYTCFAYRDHTTPNILENYTYKEYTNGAYEQYLVKYHYTTDEEGTIIYDTSMLDVEVINDEGLLFNKEVEVGCVPEFVQVLDGLVCTENTRCTGFGQHEIGDGGCLCTDSPTTCDPAGSMSCEYTYIWEYNGCSGGTTDNSDSTNNSNTPTGGGNNDTSDDETPSVPLMDPEPIWEFVLDCINGLTLPGQVDATTIDIDIIDIMRLSNNQWTTFSTQLSDSSCSEGAQEEVIEDLLDLYDDYQIINELEGKALCVYNKLKKLKSGFKNSIKKFEGSFPVAHLKFELVILDGETKGRTVMPNSNPGSPNSPDFLITIGINSSNNIYGYQQRPNLLVAKTIIHEVIHAELYRKLLSLANQGNLDFDGWTQAQQIAYAEAVKDNFPGIFNYYRRYKNWQHQQMADHYRVTIAKMLQEFDTGIPVLDNEQPQQLYLDLSWEGLIYENVNNAIQSWIALPQTERDRVEGVIETYRINNLNENCEE